PHPVAQRARQEARPREPAATRTERQLPERVCGQAMTAVEARASALGSQVLIVLGHDRPAAADRRGVVERLRPRVARAEGDAVSEPAPAPHRHRVQDRIGPRRLEQEWLHARDAQALGTAIRGAYQIEIPALAARVPEAEDPVLANLPLDV